MSRAFEIGLIGMIGLSGWLVEGRALAAEPAKRVAIRWSAPDDCPDDASAIRQIEDHLGEALSASGEQTMSVSVVVQGAPASSYSAKLRFRGAQGVQERFLDHPSCDKLTEAAALLVALAIDPERVHERQRPSPAPPAEAAPAARAEPPNLAAASRDLPPLARRAALPPRDASPANSSRAQRYRFAAALTGMTGAGALPQWGPGIGAEFGVRRSLLRLAVVARYWTPRSDTIDAAPASSVALSLVSLGFRACAVPFHQSWTLNGCAAIDWGDMLGAGEGVSDARTRHALFSAAGGSISVAYSRLRLAPYGGFELFANLNRPRFGVSVDGEARETFRPAAWSFSAFFGLMFEG
jgi:hypothetical protein